MLFIKRTFIIRQAYAMRLRHKLPSLSTYLMDMQVCFAALICGLVFYVHYTAEQWDYAIRRASGPFMPITSVLKDTKPLALSYPQKKPVWCEDMRYAKSFSIK
uniref:Uncharacterized protein n=1 Tax=Glossina austeni TaxID=7395 RepID=A0A1A9UXG4_GLOAU